MFLESRESACNTPLTSQPKTGFLNDRLVIVLWTAATEERCSCSQLLFEQSRTAFYSGFPP